MQKQSLFSLLVFFIILLIGGVLAYILHIVSDGYAGYYVSVGSIFIATAASTAVKVANQWERAIMLRLGQFYSLKGPGLFFIIPVIDTIALWIDTRIIATAFKAKRTLSKDTVPVDVDAVLFWKVIDPKKAALEVADYESAIAWASQTVLRDVIGKTMLSDMLETRSKVSNELQILIDERTKPWGIKVISVEIKDVLIPSALEDTMSMLAQAERKRQAQVILGGAEQSMAEKFSEVTGPKSTILSPLKELPEGLMKGCDAKFLS